MPISSMFVGVISLPSCPAAAKGADSGGKGNLPSTWCRLIERVSPQKSTARSRLDDAQSGCEVRCFRTSEEVVADVRQLAQQLDQEAARLFAQIAADRSR